MSEPKDIERRHGLPQDIRAMQGVWLFLIALSVFFFSSILLYVIYVAMRLAPETKLRPLEFQLPNSFIPSTLLLIGVSGALEWAVRSAKHDQHSSVRKGTFVALTMGMCFMAVQSEGMYRLIRTAAQVATSSNSIYALTFVLAFLHALHVVGGVIGLAITTLNAHRDKYDHERSVGLRFCTLYWHFLDIVWVFLMASFVIAGYLIDNTSHQSGS